VNVHKTLTKIFAVLLLIFTILTFRFANLKVTHECSGDDCTICFVIEISEQNLKLLSLILTAILVFTAKKLSFRTASFPKQVTTHNYPTLISQKIRLNN